jgi:hypothetical protein
MEAQARPEAPGHNAGTEDYKRKWRVETVVRLMKERCGKKGLLVRVLGLMFLALGTAIWAIMEAFGQTQVLLFLLSTKSTVQDYVAQAVTLIALVAAAGIVFTKIRPFFPA